jgi:hypothetical protein
MGIGSYVGIFVFILLIIDSIILLYNYIRYYNPSGCIKQGWVSFVFWTRILKTDYCIESTNADTCPDLGRWKKYKLNDTDSKHKNSLCKSEIDGLYKHTVEQNIVGGYNNMELISYVIVPTVGVLSIIWGLISTRTNKSEWTFWILIATTIITSLTSIAYDSDLSILPTKSSPLSYITDKLNFEEGDQLKYTFMAKKQNGKDCFIEGNILTGDDSPDFLPPTYTGDCNESSVPLY